VSELGIRLPDELIESIAARAAELMAEKLPKAEPPSPYFTVQEASEYLRCSRQRIYDLLSAGRLTRRKDGARVLLSRAELEGYLGS